MKTTRVRSSWASKPVCHLPVDASRGLGSNGNEIGDVLEDLRRRITDLSKALNLMVGRPGALCQPFVVAGRTRLMVTAEELSGFFPRTPATLIEWANAGKIRGKKLPPAKTGGREQWMFDLVEVQEDIDRYTVG